MIPITIAELYTMDTTPIYRSGEVLCFMCEDISAVLFGTRFNVRDTITVKLCTDWHGDEMMLNPKTQPWGIVNRKSDHPARLSYSFGTIHRISQVVTDDRTGWKIYDRTEP